MSETIAIRIDHPSNNCSLVRPSYRRHRLTGAVAADLPQVTALAVLTLAMGLLATYGSAQSSAARTPAVSSKQTNSPERLKQFLQDHFRQINAEIDEKTMFAYAFLDLNGDGRDEVIAYVRARSLCGTGGCNTYVLTPDGGSYRFVARVPATRMPIRVLDKTSHGWHSISTLIREDASRMYEGEIRFNGQKYPLGERRPAKGLRGKIVISEDTPELPLFP